LFLKILVDTREVRPYHFDRYGCETEVAALPCGDYALKGFQDRVAVERKSLDDLVSCLPGKNRERFERELQRALSFELFAVVVEAGLSELLTGRYRSQMSPKAAHESLTAFYIRYGCRSSGAATVKARNG